MYRIVIPYRPVSLNDYIRAERGSRYNAANIKKDFEKKVGMLCKALKIQKLEDRQYDLIVMHNTTDYRTDSDNLAFGLKPTLDALVKNGILGNDSYKFIRNIVHLRDKKDKYSMELYFVPANEPKLFTDLLTTVLGEQQ